MPQNAVRRERPDLYKSFNPAERLDNNRSLGLARDLACGLPLGSRRSPHSRPQNGSTTTDPSASLGISPAASHSARGARLTHARKTARQQQIPRLRSGSRLRTPTRLAALASLTPAKRLDFTKLLLSFSWSVCLFLRSYFTVRFSIARERPAWSCCRKDARPRMPTLRKFAAGLALLIAFTVTTALPAQVQEDRPAAPAQAGLLKKLGTVKSTSENTITLKSDSGPDFTA